MKRYSLHIFVLIALAILMSLGIWQLQRKTWKETLLLRLETRQAAAPIELPQHLTREDEFLRVSIKGHFRHAQEAYYFTALQPHGQGYFVFTPFVTKERLVLVNRGFVPLEFKSPQKRPESLIQEEVTISGHLRFSEKTGTFAAKDNEREHIFYTRNLEKISALLGVQETHFSIEQDNKLSNLPIPALSKVSLPNKHLDYALTWFGLALTLLGVYFSLLFSLRKKRAIIGYE